MDRSDISVSPLSSLQKRKYNSHLEKGFLATAQLVTSFLGSILAVVGFRPSRDAVYQRTFASWGR